MLISSKIGAVLFAVGAVAAAGAARAYTIGTHFTAGCHEKLTSQALRTIRADLQIPAMPPVTFDDQALMDDLQFTPDGDMRDLGGTTLLLGVRDNDLKGSSSEDLSVLAEIHGNPSTQVEHCLRGSDQKEPGGSEAAVADCWAFIRGRVLEALDGLDAAGLPDSTKRTSLSLYLALRGHVDAPLPTYYVRIGQALHAIQDGFTHTYRTADGMKITVVLDWLDSVNGTLNESRDGPAHATKLDVCDDPDDLRKTRRELVTEASTAVLRATLDPLKTHDEKVAAVDGILVTYASYSPGCTFDNDWCDAPERQYKDSGKNVLGCAAAGTGQGDGSMASWGLIALVALVSRARRRRLGASIARALVIASAITLTTGNARAQAQADKPAAVPSPAPTATSTQTTTPAQAATATTPATSATVTTTTTTTTPATPDTHAPPPPTIIAVKEPGPTDPGSMAFGAYLGWSGSVDKPAMAFQLGARLKLSRSWTVGLDGEWNPWISTNGYQVKNGVANFYGTAILRFPLAYENFNLRTTVNLGVSYLLMNLYGAPAGCLGLYAGVSPLGLEWKLSRVFLLIINPLNIALPVPQLTGVPLDYPQYRFSIGIGVLSG
jgi:MYXO-CTERM domain-containing protein